MGLKKSKVISDEPKRKGRPTYWPDEAVIKLDYKAPKSLLDKIEKKIIELKKRGISAKFANKSNLQRLIVEKAIDDVEGFFDKSFDRSK